MNTKHTPGPWAVNEIDATGDKSKHYIFIEPAVAVIERKIEGQDKNDMPDARLIAAAPDLLEAAKLVIAWYESEDDHSKADFYQRLQMCRDSEAACRSAIAKATGSAT